MKRILVPVGCRSDAGLSAPVIKQLKHYFKVDTVELEPQNFGESYLIMDRCFRENDYDFVLITGDRVEMCAAASYASHNRVPMGHFYAGVQNTPVTTYDDVDRHCITLWSDIQFCESLETSVNTAELMQAAGLTPNVYNVGISHMDDVELNDKYRNVIPYDLVLINHEPICSHTKPVSLPNQVPGRAIIQIGGNPDGICCKIDNAQRYNNLPRGQFLWLLKNCARFITNSSTAFYEAPFFLKPEQIILVGNRNRNRTPVPLETGASKRISRILARYLYDLENSND